MGLKEPLPIAISVKRLKARDPNELRHVVATVPPEAMDETAGALRDILAEMALQEVSADLLERARNPIRAGYECAERQNSAWLDVVAMAQSDPAALNRRRQRFDILSLITPADIRRAARTYLVDDRAVEICVVLESGG